MSEVGAWANAGIEAIAISGDARYVAMTSKASNLVPGAPGEAEGLTGLLRRDQVANRNEFLSTGIAGGEGSGTEAFDDDVYPFLAMTPDGSRIAFGSKASNIVPLDFAGHNDVFVLDTSLLLFGDLDGDGVVGARDIAILLGAWGSGGAADLDGNGSVGAEDLALLLGAWGG